MQLNQTILYAIAAMKHLANAPVGQVIPNSEICKTTKMPERYVLQLLRKLVNAGILVGIRGVTGGYKLAKPANRISLLEIVEAVDGLIGQYGHIDVPIPTQALKAFAAIQDDARKRLAAVSLLDLRSAKVA